MAREGGVGMAREGGVVLTRAAYLACVQHAHTTEQEEVMGLLVGAYGPGSLCEVSHAVVLRRSDKRSDRVEISPEMLAEAQEAAEEISTSEGRPRHIVGWYHSHPRITVVPSAVDLRTQRAYQAMEPRFVGLIFSVFNVAEASKEHQHVVMGFQAVEGSGGGLRRRDLPIRVTEGRDESSSAAAASAAAVAAALAEETLAELRASDEAFSAAPLRRLHNQAVASHRILALCEHIPGPISVQLAALDQWERASVVATDRQIQRYENLIERKGLREEWEDYERKIESKVLQDHSNEELAMNGVVENGIEGSNDLNSQDDGISSSLDMVSLNSD